MNDSTVLWPSVLIVADADVVFWAVMRVNYLISFWYKLLLLHFLGLL